MPGMPLRTPALVAAVFGFLGLYAYVRAWRAACGGATASWGTRGW